MFSHKITVIEPRLISAIICIFLLLVKPSSAQNVKEQDFPNHKYPEATLFGTETRVLHSKIMNIDFELYIAFPFSYFRSDTTYPVLFSLDANRSFGLVNNMVNILNIPHKEIPEILLVGIGYPIKGLEDWAIGRNRDFTPTNDPEDDEYWVNLLSRMTGRNDIVVKSGGAPQFLEFMRKELIPFIEANYRVSSTDRAIMGFSRGGLFTLYALFQYPELFKRYYAGSPSIWWDDGILFKYEEEYNANNDDLPVRLFMSNGSLESESMLSDMKKMSERLKSKNYPNLELNTHIFENETHASSYASAISRAFRVLYK